MGTPTYTKRKNFPNDNPQHRKPHGQQRLPNDVKRGTHKISTPMPYLSSQIDTSQSNIYNQLATWTGLKI